jgi:RNA polymerase sigma-70 factor (ECF subfamily)
VILFSSSFSGITGAGTRYTVVIAGMPMPSSATDLLAELPRLRRYARILTDDADRADRLVEETLLRARQMEEDPLSESTRRTQLLALLRSVSAEQTPLGTRCETPLPEPSAGRLTPNADPSESSRQSPPDRGAQVLAQLREIPLEQREVLVLAAVERMSYVDISALLQIPVATVISRLSQAREALRAIPPNPVSAPNSAS